MCSISRTLFVGWMLLTLLVMWQGQPMLRWAQQEWLFPISTVEFKDVEWHRSSIRFTPVFHKDLDGDLLSIQAYVRIGTQRIYMPVSRSDGGAVGNGRKLPGLFVPPGVPWKIRIPPAYWGSIVDVGIELVYDGMFGSLNKDFPCGCAPLVAQVGEH